MKLKDLLSADKLIERIRAGFEQVEEHRAGNIVITMADALMSAYAMFSLKDSSLLEFDERREKDGNLRRIYKLEKVPSDTQMRTIIDEVKPEEFRGQYKGAIEGLEKSKVLRKMNYLGGYYLLSVDGTGHYSSKKVHCATCLTKKDGKTGEIS
jgi:hypothetical protein